MIYLFIGFLAFLLFLLYDINSIIFRNKLLKSCFFLGIVLLAAATAGIVISCVNEMRIDLLRTTLFGFPAIIFFIFLIYTLFFAIPFQSTYIETDHAGKVCRTGVYALCRHPGVLWFAGFYITLGFALNIPLLKAAAAVFSLLNVIYIIIQDRWTFVKSFEDYEQYRTETPFLIPNYNSIKRCIKTLKGEEDTKI